MKRFRMVISRAVARCILLLPALLMVGGAARAQSTLMLDNFENGVGQWSRNDKVKSENSAAAVVLVDVLATQPMEGGSLNSQGAGLFTFKAAENSWASASLRIDGKAWAKSGARILKFWLNADGQTPGVELMLRGQTRLANGQTRDVVYELPVDPATKRPRPVHLTIKSWREVAIPLTDFRDKSGRPVTRGLDGLYLLQFVQRGTWNSRFFTVDDIRVIGTGVPIVAPPSPIAPPTDATPSGATNAVPVEVDFLRERGRIRASANVSLGARWSDPTGETTFPLETSEAFRGALRTLGPRWVRLDAATLVELTDSARPAFDFRRLISATRAVQALGLEPLVALPSPPAWGLDGRGYGVFVGSAARALNLGNRRPVRTFELSTGANAGAANAVALYNRGYAVLKAQSKTYRVGGIGSASQSTLAALVRGAVGLDFLSLPFFASGAANAPAATLFDAARNPASLRAAGALLDRSRFRNAPLYVTTANLSSSQTSGSVLPDDERLAQNIAGAWWAVLLSSGSRIGDQIFHNDAANPEWGLLNERNFAYYSYYSMYLWNTFFPAGSTRVETKIDTAKDGLGALVVTAANTATAHNVLLVNTSDRDVTARLTIRGFPVLRAARLRLLQDPLDPKTGVFFRDLAKSPFQTISLPPYAVAVLQFIEPPKKR